MFKYQKIGEMDSEYPFLFCSKSDFWMEIPDDKVNSFENTKRQTPNMTFVFVLREPFGSLLFVSTSMNESRSFFVRGLIEIWTVPNDTISYQSISV